MGKDGRAWYEKYFVEKAVDDLIELMNHIKQKGN